MLYFFKIKSTVLVQLYFRTAFIIEWGVFPLIRADESLWNFYLLKLAEGSSAGNTMKSKDVGIVDYS